MTSRERPLEGQTALVTGGNSGIGEAICRAMGGAGASVVVNYLERPEDAERVAAGIEAGGGRAVTIEADVRREDDVEQLFGQAIEKFGTVDILVNNAGIQRDAAILDMSLEQWSSVLSVNLTGSFLCARRAAREFVRRGVVPSVSCAAGKILFISSVHEAIPWARHANYAASKAGIALLMKSAARELAPRKIRVNSIAPGAVMTPINRQAWERPEAAEQLLDLVPYGRLGEPEDIASVAVWLASDASDYVTGATIFVDGGMMLYPGFSEGGGA
jgi:glucose 1-dehydrogenase